MSWQTAAGSQLRVTASHPASYTLAGYQALLSSATVVGEVSNMGEFGKEFAAVTWQALDKRGVDKKKGSYNNGMLNPSVALDPSDAGQAIMETLLDSDDSGTFFVVLQDGSAYAFDAFVTAFKPSVGEADSVVTASTTLEITRKDIVRIPPTQGGGGGS